ncbi:SpvB/TcaC N-terminal domain-containing protein [Actinomadura sp. SCN-SB]|uniref:SpvB/TcaC N-terminal domain-containing protein n=1 Tax=Actinomadura sp. SCN-SB TaxID=3373092 RepID=UPI003751E67C
MPPQERPAPPQPAPPQNVQATPDPPPSSITLPKGGGAVRGIGEKFSANPVTGTGTVSVPIMTSPGRSGFGPSLALAYDSGAGNGMCGFGWHLSLPTISRTTDRGLPRYGDGDTFLLSGAEDLVPMDGTVRREEAGRAYEVRRYRPRIETAFARIERWIDTGSGDVHWRSITRDNVTTWYGRTPLSRIADPTDPSRVFTWLICESRDGLGNAVVYGYKAEDGAGVDETAAHESNRTAADRAATRYLKTIRYGNRVSALVEPDLSRTGWHFEVVFDYGEHDECVPRPAESRRWPCRPDPFSSYRSGFEVRTYRLLRRVLMFHHFPGEDGVGKDCLVRSTDLLYRAPGVSPTGSFIASVRQTGYRRRPNGVHGYVAKSLPPLEFTYSEPVLDRHVRTLDAESARNLPYGVDGASYQWLDLNGEGLSGVVTRQGGAWYYKPNLGGGRLGPMNVLPAIPATATPQAQRFLDLAGDGEPDLVDLGGAVPGFYERAGGNGWAGFRPFPSTARIDWSAPGLRLTDLTGDGHADVMIATDESVAWYPSLAEDGFGPARRVAAPVDEDEGPRLAGADATEAVFLADMSGDRLPDLVRVRNGEVCYWPNLGHGRFDAKVTMDDSPWLDEPDQFDPRRLRLLDIDDSGTSDIVYLGRDGARVHFNRNGNAWTGPHRLPCAFPLADSLSRVTTVDLLGTGTGCLVWSSPLPGPAGTPLRYIDLMGGRKPHLLTGVRNNLGAETRVSYAPSTRFYLTDAASGRPWRTRLPFPVHVVEQVETIDHVSGNRLVTRYAYHHGYFDGPEREFRGFAMVEQWDAEEFAATGADPVVHAAPALTRTWYHTGAATDGQRVTRQHAHEYYCDDLDLDDTVLPTAARRPGGPVPWELSAAETREAYRALKGSVLRQEVYGCDGGEAAGRPYTVTERNYTIELLQPASGAGTHAVFHVHPRETLTAHYERARYPSGGRMRDDPRIGHELVLSVDDFGNVLTQASIGYGRRIPDPDLDARQRAEQHRTHVTLTENSHTNAVEEPDDYRAPSPSETRVYELRGLPLDGRFTFDDLASQIAACTATLPYQEWDRTPPGPSRRLIDHQRTVYRRDDLTGPLPPGVLEPLGLPDETYRLALPDGLTAALHGDRITAADLRAAGYVHHDGGWWSPSGRVLYSPAQNGDDESYARRHFFLPQRFSDPFGAVSTVAHDRYDLLPQQTRDPLGNLVTAGEHDSDGTVTVTGIDYRLMRPRLVMDTNRNRTEVASDALGLVTGTAVMGKPGEHAGDTLTGFDPDADGTASPRDMLAAATTRLVHDLFAYLRTRDEPQPSPASVTALSRESHADEHTRIQIGRTYSDGFGREIQRKAQAEPGPVAEGGPDVTERWAGTGWTVYNNKGKAVRQYEPFFSATPGYEPDAVAGVGSILCYDPVERVVATLHPDATWEKVVFDPWSQTAWDVNDTVLDDPREDPDVGGLLRPHLGPGWRSWHSHRDDGSLGPEQRDAARKAAAHARAPARVWLDSLGRTFLSAAHNRTGDTDETYLTRTVLDIEGNARAVVDALGRTITRDDHDMLATAVRRASMDAGERLILSDVTGKPVLTWNDRGMRFRTEYDALRRPTRVFVHHEGRESLRERTVYGEAAPGAIRLNLRGRVWKTYDGAGVATNVAFDFKGNLLRSRRHLPQDHTTVPDWSQPVVLERRHYTGDTRYDALNRPAALTSPDGSVVLPLYNEASLIERVEARLCGASTATTFIADLDYNARGQRTLCVYGNGTRTTFTYEPLTFRLASLRTVRGNEALQDLRYTYDPSGNVTHITDAAQQTVFFRNQRVDPSAEYLYDALYRLIKATGREHQGQTEALRIGLPHPGDGNAMARHTERYAYDPVGNILELTHRPADPAVPGWTRAYRYTDPSRLNPAHTGNRLTSTQVGTGPSGSYAHDQHGNLTAMPGLPTMRWNHKDELAATSRTPDGPLTHYFYDASGQRVRKATDHAVSGGRRSERLYLGAFEIHREYDHAGNVTLERETLHVLAGQQLVALVETRTSGHDRGAARLARYQLPDHLGSAFLELDAAAQIITREEFHPYGTTSYQAVRSGTETPKRYRYTGKEHDPENGLSYHGARYYAPHQTRWTAPDPVQSPERANLYAYADTNPVRFIDSSGNEPVAPPLEEETQQSRPEVSTSPPMTTRQSVGEPGFWESLIPIWGSGRESVNHFQQGNYVRGTLWGLLAISDVFLVKSLVMGVGKLVVRGGARLLAKEAVAVTAKAAPHAAAEAAPLVAAEASAAAAREYAAKASPEAWRTLPGLPRTQLLAAEGWFVKRPLPESGSLMKSWATAALEAQEQGLKKLGDLAVPHFVSEGMIFTKDAGKAMTTSGWFTQKFWSGFGRGTYRMGTLLNDIRPRNMSVGGLLFDPALDPLSKGILGWGANYAAKAPIEATAHKDEFTRTAPSASRQPVPAAP